MKEIEDNNRMGKTRDLFKKIRDTKGTFHAKMDTIKDKNCMGLTQAEGTHSSIQSSKYIFKTSENVLLFPQMKPLPAFLKSLKLKYIYTN